MKEASGVAAALAVLGVPIPALALALSVLALILSALALHRVGKVVDQLEAGLTDQAEVVAEVIEQVDVIGPPDA